MVLAEHHGRLRRLATGDLRDPVRFWAKLSGLPVAPAQVRPAGAVALLARALPQPGVSFEPRARRAGLGSLGRPRLVAVVDWKGGLVAREVKALLPSALTWAAVGDSTPPEICYEDVLARAVRSADPCTQVSGRWLVRRLAPDCARIELAQLPAERDEAQLLRSMGWELGNIHLGTKESVDAILADLGHRPRGWLADAAAVMTADTHADWEDWRK